MDQSKLKIWYYQLFTIGMLLFLTGVVGKTIYGFDKLDHFWLWGIGMYFIGSFFRELYELEPKRKMTEEEKELERKRVEELNLQNRLPRKEDK